MEDTAKQVTSALIDQGVLGLFCVLLILGLIIAGIVIRSLYNDLKALNATTLSDRERLITTLEGAKDANEQMESAISELKTSLDTRAAAITELSHQQERAAQETRHGFNNMTMVLNSIVELFKRDRHGDRP